ncbi:MAG: hypothetical protein ACOX68_03655 [Candidatus Limivicinus sp.]|jgi:fumarate reductase subunit D
MAYCKRCGAYIPDGQTECLACGYDEAEEQKKQAEEAREETLRDKASVAQEASVQETEELRKKLEEQRKRQQEASRRWAQQEKERREARAGQERERRETAAGRQQRGGENRQYGGIKMSVDPAVRRAEIADKMLAALSYISWLFIFPMLLRKDNRFVSFHARQGLALFVFGCVLHLLNAIPVLGPICEVFRVYLIFQGIINVVKGKMEPLPLIGKYVNR